MRPVDEPPLARIAAAAGDLLKQRRQTVAVAESSSGGLISAALLAVPGASSYFLGGSVIYTAASRIALLGIAAEEVRHVRPASEPYARLLARRMRERLGATWGISESGPVEAVITVETESAEREANMWRFARNAIELLESCLRHTPIG